MIQRDIRTISKAHKSTRVSKSLNEFKDLQQIADICNNDKSICVSSVLDKDDKERTDSNDRIEVFAVFYEGMYKRESCTFNPGELLGTGNVDAVTPNEVRTQLKNMKG